MNDDRTEAERYADWCAAVAKCWASGWKYYPVGKEFSMTFISPSGSMHDLSAANLDALGRIEKEKLFLLAS